MPNPSATATSTSVTVSGYAVTGATAYEVKCGSDTKSVTTTTCPAFSATANTTYSFQARAKNADGAWIPWSNSKSITTLLAAPSGLTFSNLTSESFRLSWTNISGLTYEVKRGSNGTWVSPNNGTASHNFTGLTKGTSYTVYVRAKNGNGNGAEASINVTTKANKYAATVNNFFDNGYTVRYHGNSGTQAMSRTAINGYINDVAARYLAIFDLRIDPNTATYFSSAIDTCKGTTVSCGGATNSWNCGHNNATCNINRLCTHTGTKCTERNNVTSNFNRTGSNIITNVLWSGHHVTSINSDGTTSHNRSLSNGSKVLVLNLTSATNRVRDSRGVLMHELNHQYGAPDHYHETDANGVCKFASICSDCGTNPRPKSCIMYEHNTDISANNIICNGCKSTIISHLDNHHV